MVSEKMIFESVSPKGPMSTLRTCWVGARPAGRNFERDHLRTVVTKLSSIDLAVNAEKIFECISHKVQC